MIYVKFWSSVLSRWFPYHIILFKTAWLRIQLQGHCLVLYGILSNIRKHTHTKKKKLTTRCQMCSVLDNEWTWNFSKLWSVCIAHRGFMVLISLQGVNISTPKNILILTLLKWNRTLKFWLEPSPSKLTECPSRKEPRF